MNVEVTKLLSRSRTYRNYSNVFREVTGLPLVLRSIGSQPPASTGTSRQKWSCAVLGQPSCGCKSCAKSFEQIVPGRVTRQTFGCECGHCGSAVPIQSGNDVVALLQIGSATRGEKWRRTARKQKDCSRGAALKLARIFSVRLSEMYSHMLVQKQSGEPLLVSRAKDFIARHYSESISSRVAAKELHMSRFYICKLFKSTTGLTFTAYLARVRINCAKELLRNPKLRISEIAFEAGFQSLTHFNRLFLQLTGESPSKYRERTRAA